MPTSFVRAPAPILGLTLALVVACHRPGTEPALRPPSGRATATPPGSPIDVQRAWWRAFTVADTGTLKRLSSPMLSLTLSSGRTFDRAGALHESRSHITGSRLTLDWSDESTRFLVDERIAIVAARMRETDGRTAAQYRYLTVLERRGAGDPWQVVAAQSTREVAATPRISAALTGDLGAYGGHYRVPSGAALAVAVQDSGLTLTDPNGAVLRLEPVGPGLFEATRLSASNGIVRFAFGRDGTGRVASLSRLIPGAVTMYPKADAR